MRYLLEGGRLTLTVTIILLAAVLVPFFLLDDVVASTRMIIRGTARTSLLLFLMAFVASAMVRVFPGWLTNWQRRNRRYLGLAFAVSHGLHLVAIIAFARLDPVAFWQVTNTSMVVTGGLAYLFIAAMAATSLDRAPALIGMRAWSLLHRMGAWYIWLSFAVAFGRRAAIDPAYWPAMLLIAAALVIRILAWVRMRRQVLRA
ncbi:MAG: hypothetical protein CTR54_05170 [Rhizobium sp.]|nr:MAG: hypothetical protein CTR54_05170 [Rhizobium sp.]